MFTDDRPVRRWVRVIPVIIAVTALAGTNYLGLGKHSAGFIVLLALSMLGVGFAEEGMFRGLGVVVFRVNGFTEAKVALWTCVLFGLAQANQACYRRKPCTCAAPPRTGPTTPSPRLWSRPAVCPSVRARPAVCSRALRSL